MAKIAQEHTLEQVLENVKIGSELWQNMSREGRGFTSLTGFITIPVATETDFFLMRNPIDSGFLVRFKEFIMTIGGTSAQRSIFRFYRNPTITSVGTPLSVNRVLVSSTLNSKILTYQSPTISSRGQLIQLFAVDFNTLVRDQNLSRYLVNGGDVLVTVQGSIVNLEHNILCVWGEEKI